jgi:Fic family protein
MFGYTGTILYRTPRLTPEHRRRLAELHELREEVAKLTRSPAHWIAIIRRLAIAEVSAASTAIDGFHVRLNEALEIAEGGRPPGLRDQDYLAVRCYQEAMDRVLSLVDDSGFEWTTARINDLHWLASHFQPEAEPGRLRSGPSHVSGWDGRVRYQAPRADEVPALLDQLVDSLRQLQTEDAIVRGAMAHLHLASIHPYQDGNGRTARIVHSLVLAREGVLAPEFGSVEVYLASHMQGYYEALQAAQGPSYNPTRDPSAWLDFCLDAHRHEAMRLRDRLVAASARWTLCEQLIARLHYSERFAIPLHATLAGLQVRNESYRNDASVAIATAKQDLGRMAAAGWLQPRGGGRNTHYVASDRLKGVWERTQEPLLRQTELLRQREAEGSLGRAKLRELQLLHKAVQDQIADAADVSPAPEPVPVRSRGRRQRG